MKTEFAKEKSEYSHNLMRFLDVKLPHSVRYESYRKMQKIEKILKDKGDEIAIIISTKNTFKGESAPPMEESAILTSS